MAWFFLPLNKSLSSRLTLIQNFEEQLKINQASLISARQIEE
jgi:hypothetical protein